MITKCGLMSDIRDYEKICFQALFIVPGFKARKTVRENDDEFAKIEVYLEATDKSYYLINRKSYLRHKTLEYM